MNEKPAPDQHNADPEHLRNEVQALQRELNHFRRLFDSLPIGIYRITPDGHVLLANASVAQVLGVDLAGGTAAVEQALREHQIGCRRDTFRETLEREGEVRGFERALNSAHTDQPIRIQENARVIRDEDGTPLYLECTLEEVSEHRCADAALPKTAVSPTPIDMTPIVQEVLHRLSEMIAAKRAEIVVPSAWPMALGYVPWVEEVWANYISNAITFGGDPPRVELGARLLSHGKIRLWVRDNGDGLSAERLEALFGNSTQTGPRGGHGLGLSIVKRIVEELGGDVGVESSGQPGEGSVFSFDLPAALRA
jgi:PAS domain S-box-containing protein